jgi:hypothetical protein
VNENWTTACSSKWELYIFILIDLLFRGRLSDVDNRVGLMKAEVDEMTRDRRNNVLLHGLPVQV